MAYFTSIFHETVISINENNDTDSEFVDEKNKLIKTLEKKSKQSLNKKLGKINLNADEAFKVVQDLGYQTAKYGTSNSYGLSMDQLSFKKDLKNGFISLTIIRSNGAFSFKDDKCTILIKYNNYPKSKLLNKINNSQYN